MNLDQQEQRFISVPVIPTEAMMLNGSACQHHAHDDLTCIQRDMRRGIWDKMIAAAPAQPLPLMSELNVMMEEENAELRQIISLAATACGAAVSTECSVGFMAYLPAEIEAVIGRQERELAKLRKVISEVVRGNDRWRDDGNAPGHCHQVPGIWDGDNGAKAGTECAWCKVWASAVAISREEKPDGPLMWCACGDGYPPADLATLGGVCENCQAASGAVDKTSDQKGAGSAGPAEKCRTNENAQAVQEVHRRDGYWKQRAKSAEGHLWASDFQAACDAVHKISNYADIAADELSVQQKSSIAQAVTAVLASINARRHARRPKDFEQIDTYPGQHQGEVTPETHVVHDSEGGHGQSR